MQCILIRFDHNEFGNWPNHEFFALASAVFTRTEIIDLIGKMLCTSMLPEEDPLDVFHEFIHSRIGYASDARNHASEEENRDHWTDTEKDKVLSYFMDCWKASLPYVPTGTYLRFMACVFHEAVDCQGDAVCLIAEATTDGESLNTSEPGDTIRVTCEGDGTSSGHLSVIVK